MALAIMLTPIMTHLDLSSSKATRRKRPCRASCRSERNSREMTSARTRRFGRGLHREVRRATTDAKDRSRRRTDGSAVSDAAGTKRRPATTKQKRRPVPASATASLSVASDDRRNTSDDRRNKSGHFPDPGFR